MAKLRLLLLLVIITLVAFVATLSVATSTYSSVDGATAVTVYDVLQKNGLPRGLLPKGVQSYTLTPQGKLDVILRDACEYPFTFVDGDGETYTVVVRFGDRVGGLLKSGSLQETHGVEVNFMYLWLGVSGISRSGDQIMVSLQQSDSLLFPVSRFIVSPSCM